MTKSLFTLPALLVLSLVSLHGAQSSPAPRALTVMVDSNGKLLAPAGAKFFSANSNELSVDASKIYGQLNVTNAHMQGDTVFGEGSILYADGSLYLGSGDIDMYQGWISSIGLQLSGGSLEVTHTSGPNILEGTNVIGGVTIANGSISGSFITPGTISSDALDTATRSLFGYTADVIDAKISKTDPLGAADSGAGSWASYFVRDFNGALRNKNAVMAIIGDSWSDWGTIVPTIRRKLQSVYGDAGMGYAKFCWSPADQTGIIGFLDANWIDTPPGSGNGVQSSEEYSATVGAVASVTTSFDAITVHYMIKPGGGAFNYSIDGGGLTNVSTAGASTNLGLITISGLAYGSHTFTVTVSAPGTSGVSLFGADCIRSQPGVRIENLAKIGAQASHFAKMNPVLWTNELAALNPNMVAILLGTNEKWYGTDPAVMSTNVTTIVGRVRSCLTNADIVIIAPADNGVAGVGMNVFRDMLLGCAKTNGCGFIDLYKLIGPYANGNARGWYTNTAHPSDSGSAIIANAITSFVDPNIAAANPVSGSFGSLSVAGNNLSVDTNGNTIIAPTNGTSAFAVSKQNGSRVAWVDTLNNIFYIAGSNPTLYVGSGQFYYSGGAGVLGTDGNLTPLYLKGSSVIAMPPNSTSAFSVQKTDLSKVFNVDTVNSYVTVGPSSVFTAGYAQLYNSGSYFILDTGGNTQAIKIRGLNVIVNPPDSTTAFQVLNNYTTSILTVDSLNGIVTVKTNLSTTGTNFSASVYCTNNCVIGGRLTVASYTPTSSAAAGTNGMISFDASYVYTYAGGRWYRTPISATTW